MDLADLARWIEVARDAGVDCLQLRCKRRSDAELLELARRSRALLSGSARLLINGRWDICRLAGADGVHLPAAGLPVEAVRSGLGGEALVGRSTHTLEEVDVATREGADYITFGPVYSTPGKEIYGPPVGLLQLERAAALGPPVLALGGITTIERLRACVAAGASGIAGIRLFGDPGRAAECVAALADLAE